MSDISEPANETTPPKVLKVVEGVRGRTAAARVFSVVMSSPVDDLAIIAAASDPDSGVAIPAEGSEYPGDATMIARPPVIYPVGRRAKGGAIIATCSQFYNVRVPYVQREGEL